MPRARREGTAPVSSFSCPAHPSGKLPGPSRGERGWGEGPEGLPAGGPAWRQAQGAEVRVIPALIPDASPGPETAPVAWGGRRECGPVDDE